MAVASCVLATWVQLLLGLLPLASPHSEEEAIARRVTFEAEIRCDSHSGKGGLSDIEIRAALPRSEPGQSIEDLKFDPAPDSVKDDGDGNFIATWKIARVRAGQIQTVRWSCSARIRRENRTLIEKNLRALSTTPEVIKARFMGFSPQYGMHAFAVRNLAKSLAVGVRSPRELAWKLNEHLRTHLNYRNDGVWESADQVLRNGHGSCSEYNFALMGLARLNGMAARYVGATALADDATNFVDTVHHRFTEVWMPGHGWFPVDASRNDGEENEGIVPPNQWFGRTSNRLLVLMRGEGGPHHPLGWGYVVAFQSKPVGDGRLISKKRFIWTAPSPPRAQGKPAVMETRGAQSGQNR